MPTTAAGAGARRRALLIAVAVVVVVALVMAIRLARSSSSGSGAPTPSGTVAAGSGTARWSTPASSPPTAGQTPSGSISPVPAPAAATSAVASAERSSGARLGLSMSPVGASSSTSQPWTAGIMTGGPAWSTIKIPIVLANLRAGTATGTDSTVRAALTRSDNEAAENLTRRLGADAQAARAVGAELARHHDTRTRPATTTDRPDFSVLGQTMWSLPDQTAFMASMACTADAAPVRTLMGQVASDQRWGLGTLAGSRFKGGWGPGIDGRYLVRQTGIITVGKNQYAVSMEAVASDGSFAGGTAALDRLSARLPGVAKGMAGGHCS
ncbi:hypothetical protein [Acidipropionibacterium virtanenii]|uniref:Uncharacterized protein n=1 Tax=Acidipropionibacterium virtanenii TaxID=2057246 RepID=A0A344URE0_9ACTN|nr:hypothetical protein [Acidipropionibacterium virtanenii]AXE37838.1 hypothetical protein JS278_00647 [Acidipropionibacterium virtanenii]